MSAILFVSCDSGKGEAPVITVDSIYVNGKYIKGGLDEPIPKKALIEVYTTLNALGSSTLLSFNVETICNELDGNGVCIAPMIEYEEAAVSNAGFNDMSALRFKDGVINTKVVVRAQSSSSGDNSLMFKLYLNTDDAGTKKELTFLINKKLEDQDSD